MAQQVSLKNDKIIATFSTKGAELLSLKKDGKEKIWIGDPNVWGAHAPLLFPICGGLKDDKYIYDNQEYTLQKHGYIRFFEFELESQSETQLVFLHRSNDETLKQFPFHYELRVIYTLEDSALKVDYNVKNLDEKCMYFSIGGHEGYYCPEGIEEYSVIFEQPEMLDSNILNGNLLEHQTVNVGVNTCKLPLKYEYFAVDALVFLNLKSRKVALVNQKSGEKLELEFEGQDYFLLWTKPGANYICLEPWCGCQDFVDSDYDFVNKAGIIKLDGNKAQTKTHRIIL